MKENFKSYAVVNPNAYAGRCRKIFNEILPRIKDIIPDIDFKFTERPYSAVEITRSALKQNYEMIISVGGDGTLNEVLQGFFENDKIINPDAVVGVISIGTGSDFIKSCNIPKEYNSAINLLSGRTTKKIDIGKAEFVGYDNKKTSRYFINIADFGMGGEVVDRVNRTTKFFGGFVSFLYSTLIISLKYKNKEVDIKIDDKEIKRKIKNVFIANGIACGGGMKIAPHADLSDGFFDIVILGDMSFFEGIKIIRKIYKGERINHKKVEYYSSKCLSATSVSKVLIDIDGEQPGFLPAKFEILPGVLNLKI